MQYLIFLRKISDICIGQYSVKYQPITINSYATHEFANVAKQTQVVGSL